MPSDVLMPKMGYDMTEGKILRWLKKEGDSVKRGESLAEIETDKVNIEIEAFATGTLGQIVGHEGEMIPVGQKIAVILGEGEAAPNGASETSAEAPAQPAPAAQADTGEAPRQPATPTPAAEQQTAAGTQAREAVAAPAGPEGRIKASPLARRIAQEHELDLSQIKGSGPGGRIVREDVQAALQTAPAPVQPATPAPAAPSAEAAPAAARQAPLTRMRAAIGRRMVESKTTIPHFYVSAEVDMTEALAWRKRLNDAAQAEGYKITVNDLIVKACGLALTKFPNINASFGGDHLEMHDQIDVSIAVALKEGLIAPVVRGVDKKSLGAVAREAADLVGRAREGKLTPDEFSGGTFTVSNLGPYNIETFIAIITPPQAAALAVGSSAQKAVVVNGEIVIRDRMNITISADHRVTDGAEGAQFVGEVRRLLENPLMLLM